MERSLWVVHVDISGFSAVASATTVNKKAQYADEVADVAVLLADCQYQIVVCCSLARVAVVAAVCWLGCLNVHCVRVRSIAVSTFAHCAVLSLT